MKVAVGHISTLGRIRGADPAQVKVLADSIKEVGLLSPITVARGQIVFNGQRVEGFQLVAGLHRLEACKSLGMAEVEVVVVNLDVQQRIIAECDENLCGTKLTPAERAEFTARRKEAYEALHPETVHGHNTKESRQVGDSLEPNRFTAETAVKTGRSERSIQRDAERGVGICKEAMEILKGTKADTGAFLDRIKGMKPAEQVVAAAREVQAKSAPKQKGPTIAPDPDSDEIALERQVADLMKAWNKASPDARAVFLDRIDTPVMDKGGWG